MTGMREGSDTMRWRTPTGPLVHEHGVIKRLIAVMEARTNDMRELGEADPAFVADAADFIRSYADRCHHGKEEDILFRALAGIALTEPDAAAMAELIDDHKYARGVTGRLVEANRAYAAGDSAALDGIITAMTQLVEFYPRHIAKEDRGFFPACLRYLTPDVQAAMLASYDEFDRSLIHEKYLGVVERLEQHPHDRAHAVAGAGDGARLRGM